MNHVRRALTYWYTFGYPEINSPHYIRGLACDNLDMVRRSCMFCQLFLMVMCITRLALVGCEWINLWPFVIASVIVTIILVINNRLPALTVQPIIENAIEHGIGKKENGGFVRLSARERQGVVRIEVADNGVGMDERTLYGLTGGILQTAESVDRPEGGRSHVGLTNVRERLRLMSHGTLAVSSQPGRGTTVIISIPKGIRFPIS